MERVNISDIEQTRTTTRVCTLLATLCDKFHVEKNCSAQCLCAYSTCVFHWYNLG